jgi:hypothetical protein
VTRCPHALNSIYDDGYATSALVDKSRGRSGSSPSGGESPQNHPAFKWRTRLQSEDDTHCRFPRVVGAWDHTIDGSSCPRSFSCLEGIGQQSSRRHDLAAREPCSKAPGAGPNARSSEFPSDPDCLGPFHVSMWHVLKIRRRVTKPLTPMPSRSSEGASGNALATWEHESLPVAVEPTVVKRSA